MSKTITTFEELEINLFAFFTVTLQIKDKLMGGVPKHPDVIEGWIKATLSDEHRLTLVIDKTKEEMKTGELSEENLKTLKETAWNGFKSDDKGIYIEGRQVKAMLKESANIVKSKVDMTALKARISERVFVVEDRIHLGTDTPSGVHDSVVHAMTAQGPISALKKSDYVNTPTISFTLKVLDEPLVTKTKKNKITPSAYLPLLLNVAAEQGLGADRSQGYGKFSFTCVWEV